MEEGNKNKFGNMIDKIADSKAWEVTKKVGKVALTAVLVPVLALKMAAEVHAMDTEDEDAGGYNEPTTTISEVVTEAEGETTWVEDTSFKETTEPSTTTGTPPSSDTTTGGSTTTGERPTCPKLEWPKCEWNINFDWEMNCKIFVDLCIKMFGWVVGIAGFAYDYFCTIHPKPTETTTTTTTSAVEVDPPTEEKGGMDSGKIALIGAGGVGAAGFLLLGHMKRKQRIAEMKLVV